MLSTALVFGAEQIQKLFTIRNVIFFDALTIFCEKLLRFSLLFSIAAVSSNYTIHFQSRDSTGLTRSFDDRV